MDGIIWNLGICMIFNAAPITHSNIFHKPQEYWQKIVELARAPHEGWEVDRFRHDLLKTNFNWPSAVCL